ncbi:hypothetical protein [Microbacterium gorillae]|uniref:hypothetical protein n=1 Tax=Microbacterium gorillae TaxID=1231063 RepID=UPI00058CCBC6|nr:hypothetical protein [Microbacterium gorillae]
MEWWNAWWVLIPIAGMVVGVINRGQAGRLRQAKYKHELEMQRMQLQAQQQPAVESTQRDALTPPVSDDDQLARVMAEHDEVTGRWLDYELDVAKLIAFPAMSDGRRDLTAAFLRAKRTADSLRPRSADAKLTSEQMTAYRDAVTDYAVKFDIAEQDARRIRDADFTADERSRLDRARQLLKTAVDTSATNAERQLAYRRVRDEIDGLIVLSPEAVTILETKVGKEITPGPATGATPPAG